MIAPNLMINDLGSTAIAGAVDFKVHVKVVAIGFTVNKDVVIGIVDKRNPHRRCRRWRRCRACVKLVVADAVAMGQAPGNR